MAVTLNPTLQLINIMIRFGPSGSSAEFGVNKKNTVADMPEWLAARELNAYELPFGMGITMNLERADMLNPLFASHGIEVSAHCPYYINLASQEQEKIDAIPRYIIGTMQRVEAIGGKRSVFHAGSIKKLARSEAMSIAKDCLKRIVDSIYENGYAHHMLAIETMGKHAQIGTLDEVIELCNIDKILYPCIDFGHLNARGNGYIKGYAEYKDIITRLTDNLDYNKVRDMHVHFSKIEYTQKGGEVRHLTLEDTSYGPPFEPLMQALHDYKLEPYIVSESAGTQDVDAMTMRNYYNAIK